ncbi:MAG TPA: GNAT family N-acetyltransferase [Acidimicrobiales bacterium]|nr:GNAT family N-acetyltransferase [Acidimicrobiales bacterium]
MDRDTLLAAGDRNLADVLRLAARHAPDGASDDDGQLLLVSLSRTWPGPYTNGALRLDHSLSAAEVLVRAESFFAGRCPGYCIWIAAHADADLEETALAANLVQISPTGSPRMALDHPLAMAEPAGGVALHEVVDESGRRDYLAVTLASYDKALMPQDVAEAQLATVESLAGPTVHAVVARADGRPVAAAMVVLSGDVAGIQLVGTVPGARGRGLGELCTRWAANAGFASGAGAVVLEASDMGEPLYRRMGFVEVSRFRWCFGPPPVSRSEAR